MKMGPQGPVSFRESTIRLPVVARKLP
jgi:hypothetical protein